jgi:hypothetical protein
MCRAGNEDVKVALHVQAHNAEQTCADVPALQSCGDFATTYSGCGDIDVFTVFFDFEGLTVTEWGLDWPVEWGSGLTTHCALLSINDIIMPGDWISLAWGDCQPGPAIVSAWTRLSAGTPGRVDPIPRPQHGSLPPFLGICDCDFMEIDVICAFGAGVCGIYGDDPCGPLATEATTWGAIKGMFR